VILGPICRLPSHRAPVVLFYSSFFCPWSCLFLPLPVLVFLVSLEFASSSGSMRDLLLGRVEPSGSASSSVSSQSTMSCCSSSSWVGSLGPGVLEGGVGRPCYVVSAPTSAAPSAVWKRGVGSRLLCRLIGVVRVCCIGRRGCVESRCRCFCGACSCRRCNNC